MKNANAPGRFARHAPVLAKLRDASFERTNRVASIVSAVKKRTADDVVSSGTHIRGGTKEGSMNEAAISVALRETGVPAAVPPNLRIVGKSKFVKVRDGRGRSVDGLWLRNGRYYYQLSVPGKGCRRVTLFGETNQPVKSVQEAKDAIDQLRRKKREGELPASKRAPFLPDYVEHYLSWMEQTEAKSPKTMTAEKSSLGRWVKYFGAIRLTEITLRRISDFVLARKGEGVGNRTVNLDVLVLGNLYRFAKKEREFNGKLPTEGWEPLEYRPAKKQLLTKEEIGLVCDIAVSLKEDGCPLFQNGEMLADAIRFMSLCGARVQSAFAVRWSDIDWERRQLHFVLGTKYSKEIVVDFNPELEALLKRLYAHRLPNSTVVFPGNRSDEGGSVGSLRATFEMVRDRANLPHFTFHSLRHYFISTCVMSGIDLLTIASWVGHADTVLISRVYGHLTSGHKQEAARKLDFGGISDQKPQNAVTFLDVNELSASDLLKLLQARMTKEAAPAVT